MSKIVKYPFGHADTQTIAFEATMSADVQNQLTILNIGKNTSASQLDLDVDSEVEDGAELVISTECDGTQHALTFGAGFNAKAITHTASKKVVITFKMVNGEFVLVSNQLTN